MIHGHGSSSWSLYAASSRLIRNLPGHGLFLAANHWLVLSFVILSGQEIDGVRKEKERLTAAWTSHTFGLTAHFSFKILTSGVYPGG